MKQKELDKLTRAIGIDKALDKIGIKLSINQHFYLQTRKSTKIIHSYTHIHTEKSAHIHLTVNLFSIFVLFLFCLIFFNTSSLFTYRKYTKYHIVFYFLNLKYKRKCNIFVNSSNACDIL